MNPLKEKTKKDLKNIIVILSVVIILILVSILVPLIWPLSQFAAFIDATIGKFFNLFDFFKNKYVIIIESIVIIFFMWLLSKALLLIISLLKVKSFRGNTIANLMNSTIKYLASIIAIFLILSAWGVQTPTLLAGAGIIGLAISFGAQSLIEDIIAGLFIIFERQYSVGDIIQIGDFRGIVKEISLRVTKFEDINGDIKIINNSDIRGAINTTSSLSKAICEISISYDEDIEKVEKIIYANLEKIKDNIPQLEEGPYYMGVQSLADSSVVLRIVGMVQEHNRYNVARALNREMKILFDKNKISIPFPQLVVHEASKKE
jgi:small conductance mechanosensitive channel